MLPAMLNSFKSIFKGTSQLIRKYEFLSLPNENIFNALSGEFFLKSRKQNFHLSTPCSDRTMRILDTRRGRRDAAKKTAIQPSSAVYGDFLKKRSEGYFPTADLPNTLFDGIPFRNIPIVHIKVSRNNTILSLSDQGISKLSRSCGTEGFKNSRKGTNVAAQTAGTALGLRAVKQGYKSVRVVLKGLGPGRLSAVKGLQISGVNVVSITDNTVDYTSLRPRKHKRL